jgi:DNA-binding LacI/PurR family transcriptional regulator
MAIKSSGETAKKPVSIKGISQATGFSTTTVSMVLNGRAGDFNISNDTRDLILATAKTLNYQPNMHARNLRAGRADIVGLMVPTLRNHFFGEMAETFEALARADHKLALISVTQYDRAEELNAIKYFQSQNADCVFVANPMELDQVSALCARGGTRQIFLDAEVNSRNAVSTDNHAAALALTREVIISMRAAGQTGRLYYLGGMADHKVTRMRLNAFANALDESGLGFNEDQVVWTPFDADAAYEKVRELFQTRDDVGGLFINSMLPMEGLIRFFPERQEQCRRIHFGVFDYHPYLSLLSELNIVSVRQNPNSMMNQAFELFRSGAPLDEGAIVTVPHELFHTPAFRAYLEHNAT